MLYLHYHVVSVLPLVQCCICITPGTVLYLPTTTSRRPPSPASACRVTMQPPAGSASPAAAHQGPPAEPAEVVVVAAYVASTAWHQYSHISC